jgi:predicted GTPase
MINKITMTSVASYKQPTSLETDKRVNLIYGLNGTGKSTLSNYLYQPQSEEYAACRKVGSADAELLVYNSSERRLG